MTERTTNVSTVVAWILAALFGFTAVWLAERYFVARSENARLADQKAILDVALKSAETQLATERVVSAQLARRLRPLQETSTPGATHLADSSQFRLITLTPSSAGAASPLALVAWNQDQQQGLFAAVNLPPTKDAQRYQLWIGASARVRGADFSVGADGRAMFTFKPAVPLTVADGFVVTRAAAESPAQPSEGEVLLTGQ